MEASAARVLLVDDDPYVLKAYTRVLRRAGYEAQTAANGAIALEAIRAGAFDVVVSDIQMPRMDGLALLNAVHQRDAQLPVLLVTGGPQVETAMEAINNGAVKYLSKPIDAETLCAAVGRALAAKQAPEQRDAVARLDARMDAALAGLWMAYQPIVSWRDRRIIGYEALLRTTEPSLVRPNEFLAAAERLGRLEELGRTIRSKVAQATAELPDGLRMFVNLHAADMVDEDLHDSHSPLSKVADRVMLEITERASLDSIEEPRACVDALRRLGFHIAIDDLGAGYAGLASLAQLEPDLVKIDMSLVRDVHIRTKNQTLIRAILDLGRSLGFETVTEGVETPAERDALATVGCDLLQGYLFGRPGHGFEAAAF